MSNRSRREAASRAEARRRARYQAQGREPGEGDEEDEESSAASGSAARPARGGDTFLTRLFPPAPPLPGRPDPLAGFTYAGPLRGIVSGLYLLARNPVAWLLPAAGWIAGRILTAMSVGILEIAATILTFIALLAAGWIGWQRPWLFGLAAAIAGSTVFSFTWAQLIGSLPSVEFSTEQIFVAIFIQETFQWLFGILAGWYGGYLRRRTVVAPEAGARRRR
jgi:hypothetical protein